MIDPISTPTPCHTRLTLSHRERTTRPQIAHLNNRTKKVCPGLIRSSSTARDITQSQETKVLPGQSLGSKRHETCRELQICTRDTAPALTCQAILVKVQNVQGRQLPELPRYRACAEHQHIRLDRITRLVTGVGGIPRAAPQRRWRCNLHGPALAYPMERAPPSPGVRQHRSYICSHHALVVERTRYSQLARHKYTSREHICM